MDRDCFVLGHRYHRSRGVVLLEMREYVDVLSKQCFHETTVVLGMKMVLDWARWRGGRFGGLVLELNPHRGFELRKSAGPGKALCGIWIDVLFQWIRGSV